MWQPDGEMQMNILLVYSHGLDSRRGFELGRGCSDRMESGWKSICRMHYPKWQGFRLEGNIFNGSRMTHHYPVSERMEVSR